MGIENTVGKKLTFWCECYIYTGIVKEVTDEEVVLTNASVVYETGPLNATTFKDAQQLPNDWSIRRDKIESYGDMGR